jgi:hypothetical protein
MTTLFRGAKVRRQVNIATPPELCHILHPQVKYVSPIGLEVAREGAKRRKSWARRWFKVHKPGSMYP